MACDALQDRAVLAIDRNDLTAAGCARLLNYVAGNDQCLLVGESDALSFLERSQGCVESRRADDSVEHDVDIVARCRGDQRIGATLPGIVGIALLFNHPDECWSEPLHLFAEERAI